MPLPLMLLITAAPSRSAISVIASIAFIWDGVYAGRTTTTVAMSILFRSALEEVVPM